MSFSEKVSMSGTALSFLLNECVNSANGQEGLLLGDVMSEITNHISDLHNDLCRLDTDIAVRTILPFPEIAHFYTSTGKINSDALESFLSNADMQVIGWYKYRKGNLLKCTLRDKIVTKGLQKHFEGRYDRKHFVSCMITCKESASTSTRSYIYKFYKINRYGICESIPDFTGNLGEKVTGYKKTCQRSTHKLFDKIVQSAELGDFRSSDAIFKIQKCLDDQLVKEAAQAVSNEKRIRALEVEIQQMTALLSEQHGAVTTERANKFLLEQVQKAEKQIIEVCTRAAAEAPSNDLISFSDDLIALDKKEIEPSVTAVVIESGSSKKLDYASILKKNIEKEDKFSKNSMDKRVKPISLLDCDMDEGTQLKAENASSKTNNLPSPGVSRDTDPDCIIESSQEY